MKQDFRFHHKIRVRFSETDLQGIVFNANYLIYCDVAWTEYLRALGLTWHAMVQGGVDTVLARTHSSSSRPPALMRCSQSMCASRRSEPPAYFWV